MSKLTKKQKAQQGKIVATKLYPFGDALALVKEFANAKFDESIDVAVQLGVDAKKSDQVVRGAVVMPNGTGKTKRVAVFAQGAKAEEAKAAGADIVGMDDLAAEIKAGKESSPTHVFVAYFHGKGRNNAGQVQNDFTDDSAFDLLMASACTVLGLTRDDFRQLGSLAYGHDSPELA